jgi:hypothetical protein
VLTEPSDQARQIKASWRQLRDVGLIVQCFRQLVRMNLVPLRDTAVGLGYLLTTPAHSLLLSSKPFVELLAFEVDPLKAMASILCHANERTVPAEVNVERNEPSLNVRAAKVPYHKLQPVRCRNFDLVEQPTAVSQGSPIVEEPCRMIATRIEDGPPVRVEGCIHFLEQIDDALCHLLGRPR